MDRHTAPPKRSDAERNRSKIIAVARTAFAEPGAPPSMAEIARRAGVGMATLYRNFPNRLELVEELFRHTVDDVSAAAESAEGRTPGERFFNWLGYFQRAGARKGPLAALILADTTSENPVLTESKSRTIAAGTPLFAAAQRSGEVRDDIALGQVLDAVVALGNMADDPAHPSAPLRAFFDGLRSRAT
jgi:AcrR family transcriptional regulator